MKKLSYLFSAAVLSLLLVSVGCDSGGGDETPAVDQVGSTFSGNWTAASVTGPQGASDDRTSLYSDFILKVNYTAGKATNTYTASGGPGGSNVVPFANSGNWEFKNPTGLTAGATDFNIIRKDAAGGDLAITVSNLTESTMTLTLTGYSSTVHDSYKVQSVDGDWTFTFTK